MVTTRHPSGARRAKRLATLAAALALCGAPAAHAAAGSLEASIEPQIVDAGDPVRLTLRFRGDAAAARPDLAPLANDFEVLGSQQSQRVSIVDGAVDETREVQVLLSPKHGGEIVIPALHAGDLASEPLRLTVRDDGASAATAPNGPAATAPSAAASRGASATSGTAPSSASTDNAATRAARNGKAPPDLFVDASVDQTTPFVQGEVRYTVRVYDGLGIREGALTEPTANGIRLEPRGDTRTYEDVVAGRRYMVHERVYAAFPQNGGEVTIPPVVLQARVPDEQGRGARRSPFDDMDAGDDVFAEMFAQMRRSGFGGSILDRMMDPGHEVRVRSNPVTLNVQGRPAEAANGWFLPATSVTLAQSWSPVRPSFRVGETVTRTVTLHAEGASASQMPTIATGDVAGVKQYAAKPATRSIAGGAELVQTFDVLPTTAGTITLPRIEVPWWDTASGTQRTAVLAEETIEVAPAPGSATQQAASVPSAAKQPIAGSHAAASGAAPAAGAPHASAKSTDADAHSGATGDGADAGGGVASLVTSHSGALAAAAATLLALIGGAAWTSRRRRSATPSTTAGGASTGATSRSPMRPSARALVDDVQRACAANDPRAVRSALVAWGRATWSDAPPANVAAIARRLGDDAFLRAVKSLDDSLYAPQASSFDGAAFRRAFDGARRTATRGGGEPAAVLPALYPESRLA